MKYFYGVITIAWISNLISFIVSGDINKMIIYCAFVIVILVFAQYTIEEIIEDH